MSRPQMFCLSLIHISRLLFVDKIQEAWIKIISDAPIAVIKELAAAVHHTYGQKCRKSLKSGWANGNRLCILDAKRKFYEIRPNPLNMAAACNLLRPCKYIIQNKSDIIYGYENFMGQSPIHIAAQNGHFIVFKELYEDSSDKCPQNICGQTPYHLAARFGHLKIFLFMFENSASKNPADFEGKTVLHYAARFGHLELCQMIINCDTVLEKNPCGKNGKTPLHFAAENGHSEIFKLIWETDGAGSKRSKFNGQTAFHIAAMKGHVEICKYLLDSLDNKNPCSKNGKTLLYYAAKNNLFEICKLFLHYDIEINQKEMNMLMKNGHMELINLFKEASAARR